MSTDLQYLGGLMPNNLEMNENVAHFANTLSAESKAYKAQQKNATDIKLTWAKPANSTSKNSGHKRRRQVFEEINVRQKCIGGEYKNLKVLVMR